MKNVIILLLMLSIRLLAQEDSVYCKRLIEERDRIIDPKLISHPVMEIPEFIGRMDSLITLITNPPYPQAATENKIEGKVYITFIVDTNGVPCCFEIQQRKQLGYGCEESALKYLKELNLRFTHAVYPATTGKKVPEKIVLPVTFSLKNRKE
ncbi:MAG: energy transducer TonB [bacterium]